MNVNQNVVVRGGGTNTVRYAYPTPTPTYTPIVTNYTQPNVTVAANTTGGYRYVNVASIPYTGTEELAYVLTMIAVALAAGAGLFFYKNQLFAAFAGTGATPTILSEEIVEGDDDADEVVEESTASTEHTLALENDGNGPKLSFIAR